MFQFRRPNTTPGWTGGSFLVANAVADTAAATGPGADVIQFFPGAGFLILEGL